MAKDKVGKVMHEYRVGKLHSGKPGPGKEGKDSKAHERREPRKHRELERVFQGAARGHPDPYEGQRRLQKKTAPRGR